MRENARQTSCLSNEKQIGLGISQYLQDTDETYPYRANFPSAGPNTSWKNSVAPYIQSKNVFICPDNSFNTLSDNDSTPGFAVSYGVSCVDNNPAVYQVGLFGSNSGNAAAIAQIDTPSTTIELLEENWRNTDFIFSNGYFATLGDGENGTIPSIFAGRTGLTNYCFADGHTKALKPSATLATSEGGSGIVDAWTRNGSALNSGSADQNIQNTVKYYPG